MIQISVLTALRIPVFLSSFKNLQVESKPVLIHAPKGTQVTVLQTLKLAQLVTLDVPLVLRTIKLET